MLNQIQTIEDVKTFTKKVVQEGTNFHPDDDFREVINNNTGELTYTKEEADLRNRLVEDCFKVCQKNGKDYYSFGKNIFLEETGLDKFIPKEAE